MDALEGTNFMDKQERCEILVLGCGIAGAAAALFAAREGRKVHVIERAVADDPSSRPEWLHDEGVKLLETAGIPVKDSTIGKIERVRFVDAASNRTAEGKLDSPVTVVDSTKVKGALARAAQAAGATVLTGVIATRLNAREELIEVVDSKGGIHGGQVLLLADGVGTLGKSLPAIARGDDSTRVTTQCEWMGHEGSADAERRRMGELVIRISALEPDCYGYKLVAGSALAVGWVGTAEGDKARRGLVEAARKLKSPGDAIPDDEIGRVARLRRIPRGAALEMETHVAKRAILIGDAGGFVAAFGHDCLYPALWASRIAADVAHRALGSPHPQDTLAEFDSLWRRDMVEYLRIPNTDLRFLIPLVFSNAVMAKKLAGAFVTGTNI